MTAEHVRNTAGAYPGAPANAVANLNELENWLGRELNFVSLNLGITGDAVLDFKEARSVSRALYVNEGCFRMEYPDKIMCVTMPIATAPPNAGLSPAQRRR